MNLSYFLTYPGDAIMPPNNPYNGEEEYNDPVYPEEEEAPVETIDIDAAPITPVEKETEAPVQNATTAIQDDLTKETHASALASETPLKSAESQYGGLTQALYIVIPLLLIALITVIIMLIVSKNKKKKAAAAAQQYINNNTPYNGNNSNQPYYPNNDYNDPNAQ